MVDKLKLDLADPCMQYTKPLSHLVSEFHSTLSERGVVLRLSLVEVHPTYQAHEPSAEDPRQKLRCTRCVFVQPHKENPFLTNHTSSMRVLCLLRRHQVSTPHGISLTDGQQYLPPTAARTIRRRPAGLSVGRARGAGATTTRPCIRRRPCTSSLVLDGAAVRTHDGPPDLEPPCRFGRRAVDDLAKVFTQKDFVVTIDLLEANPHVKYDWDRTTKLHSQLYQEQL